MANSILVTDQVKFNSIIFQLKNVESYKLSNLFASSIEKW